MLSIKENFIDIFSKSVTLGNRLIAILTLFLHFAAASILFGVGYKVINESSIDVVGTARVVVAAKDSTSLVGQPIVAGTVIGYLGGTARIKMIEVMIGDKSVRQFIDKDLYNKLHDRSVVTVDYGLGRLDYEIVIIDVRP